MRQPALGIKIAELRKAKGLTQEELVEKCNISVRTIQRIETGEVTPRSYTIKTILAALDYDLGRMASEDKTFMDSFMDKVRSIMLIEMDIDKPSDLIIKQLHIAWIFGVIYFLLGFFEGAADNFLFKEDRMIYSNGIYYDFISLFYDAVEVDFITAGYAVTFGILGIVYGVSLLRLKGSVGRISTYAGILEIIGGCFLLTVVLAFIGLLIYIPAELIEIIIIFKVIEIIKTKQGENSVAYQTA